MSRSRGSHRERKIQCSTNGREKSSMYTLNQGGSEREGSSMYTLTHLLSSRDVGWLEGVDE